MLDHIKSYFNKASDTFANLFGYEASDAVDLKSIQSFNQSMTHSILSSALPYESYDEISQIFFNKKSRGFILELSLLMGSSEEIENILQSMIVDIIPAEVDVQFTLMSSPRISPMLNAYHQLRQHDEVFSFLSKKRVDYFKQGTSTSMTQNGTYLLKDIKLFLSISMPNRTDNEEGDLIRIREDIQSSLQSIGMASRIVDAQIFLNEFHYLVAPSTSTNYPDRKWNPLDMLSDQLIDREWDKRFKRNKMIFSSSKEEIIEARILTVDTFPDYPTQWKIAENLGQMFNVNLQMPCPFIVNFAFRKMVQDKAVLITQTCFADREKTSTNPLAKWNPRVQKEFKDWTFLRDRIGEGDALVKWHYNLIFFTHPEKANWCERRIRDLYRANGWKLIKEHCIEQQSYFSFFPMILSEGMYEDLAISKRLTTARAFNAVNVAPMQGEWKGTKTPAMLLPTRRGQIASWFPFDSDGTNFNVCIAASAGRGKTVFTQEYVSSVLAQGGLVRIIDIGRSYQKICQNFDGVFINFSKEDSIRLNPFTTITDLDESLDLLKPLIAMMARPIKGASEEELSFIEQGIKAVFNEHNNQSTISDLVEWFNAHHDPVAKNLSHLLYPYSKEGKYGKYFEGDSTINLNNRLVVLELEELKNKKDLKRIVFLILIYHIGNSFYLGDRSQIKTCIIDEAWSLLDTEDPQTASFIETGYRTARKHNANFVTITQSLIDYQKNPMAKSSFENSESKIILGQSDQTINEAKEKKIIDMNVYEERLYKSLRTTQQYSELIIKSSLGLSVHRLILDPYARILYSTKGQEFEAVSKYQLQGLSLSESIERVVREFGHV